MPFGEIAAAAKIVSEVVSAAKVTEGVYKALDEGELIEAIGNAAKSAVESKLLNSLGDAARKIKLPDASGAPKYTMKLPDAMNLKPPEVQEVSKLADSGKEQMKTVIDSSLEGASKDLENSGQSKRSNEDAQVENKKTSEDRIIPSLSDNKVDVLDNASQKIADILKTPEGIKELIDKHPEKAEFFESVLKAVDTLNDTDATPLEKMRALRNIESLKGTVLELATKDALSEAGLAVEEKQRTVMGIDGETRPDIIAKNNSETPVSIMGIVIKPGETISVECKCGRSAYLENQLKNHIPNQLSGHEGYSVLLTTSDIKNVSSGLAEEICSQYNAKLVVVDIAASDVEAAIKGVNL